MESEINRIYGNRLRVRVCGLCWSSGKLLMVNHKMTNNTGFWAPPGGGLEFGDTVAGTIVREFKEETTLDVTPGPFLFGCEFNRHPLHAIELFFEVKSNSNAAMAGHDPELQIISAARFLTPAEIDAIPAENLHGIFRLHKADELMSLRGFYTI